MILAVGQEMQIYSSANLKDWAYESSLVKVRGLMVVYGNVPT